MERLLLLATTATYKAQAFLQAARKLDVAVVVGSDRKQALESLNPAGSFVADFNDPKAGSRQVVEFAKRFTITGVVAADDEGTLLAAHATRALGLLGNTVEAVTSARNKKRTREILTAAGLDQPPFRSFSIDADPIRVAREMATPGPSQALEFPCVLKPFALSASRGVIRADQENEFVAAFGRIAGLLRRDQKRDPWAGEILVEGYVPGLEVALEGLVSGGRLRVLAIFDKPDPLEGPYFEETIYVTPSRHPPDVQRTIVETTTRALEALGLGEGPVHAELRFNDEGCWFLEAAPRTIGGLCSRALRFQGEVSLEELVARHALGRPFASIEREESASGVLMIPVPKSGILRGVQRLEEARSVGGIENLRITIPQGQPVAPPPDGSRYLGFVFARCTTPEQVEAALRSSHERLRIVIEPPA